MSMFEMTGKIMKLTLRTSGDEALNSVKRT